MHEAQMFCENQGGNLASFHSQEENDIAFNMTGGAGGSIRFWFGFHDLSLEGDFEWTDGTCVDYTNWAPGEPNDWGSGEDCSMFWTGSGQWNDLDCNSKLPYICRFQI